MTIKPKKILLVKNRALGDAIITLATAKFIRQQFPDAEIHYATPQWTVPLFETMDHPYDCIIPLNIRQVGDVWKLLKELFYQKYDLIYEFHYGPRTGRIFKLYSYLSGASYFYHNHHKSEIDSIINRDLKGFCQSLALTPPASAQFIPAVRSYQQLRNVLFGVVATRETKMWPLENFIDLAKKLTQKFPQVKITVPLSNSSVDRDIKSKLEALDEKKLLHFVHLPLNELPPLFQTTDLYVGNDTGLKHLAVFCGVRSLSFFGPEDPFEWHPYSRQDHPYFFIKDMPCRYRSAHYCGLTQCDSMLCLNSITVDQVLESI